MERRGRFNVSMAKYSEAAMLDNSRLANSRFSQREERACNRADALLFNKIKYLTK